MYQPQEVGYPCEVSGRRATFTYAIDPGQVGRVLLWAFLQISKGQERVPEYALSDAFNRELDNNGLAGGSRVTVKVTPTIYTCSFASE